MKKFLKLLIGRFSTFLFFIALQLGVIVWVFLNFMNVIPYYLPIAYTLGFVSVFYVVSKDDNPVYKIAWIIIILATPILGVPFYVIFGNKRINRSVAKEMARYQEHYERERKATLPEPKKEVCSHLGQRSENLVRQARYIKNLTGAALWEHTESTYFPSGEKAFSHMLSEVSQAKKYILIESFIVEEGYMWNTMLSLLQKKLTQGVIVKLLYDDMGSIKTLPSQYEKTLRAMGIEVGVFNRLKPHLNPRLNYRDHRKILIVDGDVGFTGGINFADEYINRTIKFGHWKDSAVMLKGEGVWNLTLMFMQQWMFTTGEDIDLTFYTPRKKFPSDGFVQPFGDRPLDGENIAENAYIQIINHARKYVWITTPYLILDTQMITALSIAAQSGVDVKIITPFYPDKWYVHPVTRANYLPLLQSGVRIYEYVPGFIHAKMFVADDEVSIVGTTNMDFRSFYLHFECGVAFFFSSVVHAVRNDIARTLDLCKEITLYEEEQVPIVCTIGRNLLKLFSPLM